MKNTCLLLISLMLGACSSSRQEGCSRPQSAAQLASEPNEPTPTAHFPMAGGYSEAVDVSEEDLTLFTQTYDGDVKLTPLSVSTQVVAGINYRFICKSDDNRHYEVVIYQPLRGKATLTSFSELR